VPDAELDLDDEEKPEKLLDKFDVDLPFDWDRFSRSSLAAARRTVSNFASSAAHCRRLLISIFSSLSVVSGLSAAFLPALDVLWAASSQVPRVGSKCGGAGTAGPMKKKGQRRRRIEEAAWQISSNSRIKNQNQSIINERTYTLRYTGDAPGARRADTDINPAVWVCMCVVLRRKMAVTAC